MHWQNILKPKFFNKTEHVDRCVLYCSNGFLYLCLVMAKKTKSVKPILQQPPVKTGKKKKQ